MKKLSKEAESRVLTALESVADAVNEGTSPNDAIVKAASENDIPAGHINLMVSAYNTGRTGKQRMAAENPFDKAATFELADHQDIMSRLYPTNVKSAAQKRDEIIIDDEYTRAPIFAQRKQASYVAARDIDWKLVDKPEPYPGEAHTAVKKAIHSVEFDKRRFEECRREVARAKDILTSNFEKLSNYFRTPGGVSFDDACDVVEIQHGGMGRAILNQVSRIVPQFSKEAKHDCSAIHPRSTHEQWMSQKKKKRQEKHAGLVEVQPTQAPWTWIRECVKLAADVHDKQRTLHELAKHVTKKAEDQIRPFDPRRGRSVLDLPSPTTNEKQAIWPFKKKEKKEEEQDEGYVGNLLESDAGETARVLVAPPELEGDAIAEWYLDQMRAEDEKQSEAAQPADQTPRHDCNKVHPGMKHEEWKASLEKKASMAPLYGAGAGLAGGGLLHYLKNKDKEEDEERSSLLGDLALGGAVGFGGGAAYDAFAGKPNEPTAGNPILEKAKAEQARAAEGAAAPGGPMRVDPDEALAGVDEAGNAIVPAGTSDQPAGEQTLQGAMPVSELMERSLANPDPTPPYVPRARNEFVNKPLPWTGEHDESYMAPPASSDPTGHADYHTDPPSVEASRPSEQQSDLRSVFEGPDRRSVFEDPDRQSVFDPLEKQNSVGSIFALSHLLKGVQSGVTGAHAGQEAAIADYIEELDDPAHREEMRRIQIRAQLENMMANDPIISQEDPTMVAEAYNEIVQLAPRAADSPLLMRNLIRQHLAGVEGGGGIMDPRDIGANIIGNEKDLASAAEYNEKAMQAPGMMGSRSLTEGQGQQLEYQGKTLENVLTEADKRIQIVGGKAKGFGKSVYGLGKELAQTEGTSIFDPDPTKRQERLQQERDWDSESKRRRQAASTP